MGTRGEDLAWAAGLFEGEGYFGSHSYSISQVDRWPIDRFCEIVGFGHVLGPYQPHASKGPNARPFFLWRVGSREQKQSLAMLLDPWLSPRRRQAVLDTLHPDRRVKTHCKYGHELTQGKRQKVCITCKRAEARSPQARARAHERYIRERQLAENLHMTVAALRATLSLRREERPQAANAGLLMPAKD